jgi:hypothetical protein
LEEFTYSKWKMVSAFWEWQRAASRRISRHFAATVCVTAKMRFGFVSREEKSAND